MTEQTDAAEVVFEGHAYTYPDSFCECSVYVGGYADWRCHMADVLLASDWLAAREAAAEARGAQAVLAAVEDLGPWPETARVLAAARAAAAAAGGGA